MYLSAMLVYVLCCCTCTFVVKRILAQHVMHIATHVYIVVHITQFIHLCILTWQYALSMLQPIYDQNVNISDEIGTDLKDKN